MLYLIWLELHFVSPRLPHQDTLMRELEHLNRQLQEYPGVY